MLCLPLLIVADILPLPYELEEVRYKVSVTSKSNGKLFNIES